jgi:hypothetical protein
MSDRPPNEPAELAVTPREAKRTDPRVRPRIVPGMRRSAGFGYAVYRGARLHRLLEMLGRGLLVPSGALTKTARKHS